MQRFIDPKAIYMYLIGLNFRGFFPVVFGGSFICRYIACFFLDFYQNHMAFWPQTSSFSFERDFNNIQQLQMQIHHNLINFAIVVFVFVIFGVPNR